MTPKTPRNGYNGRVLALKHRTPEGTIIYDIGPWPSAQKTADAPVADTPTPAPTVPVSTPPPVQPYGEPLEQMTANYLATPLPPFHPPEPVEHSPPSHLEQAISGLDQASDALSEVHHGLSSVVTIGTCTAAGLVAGIGFGALAYKLMVNPRSVSASLLVGGICTFAGVVAGWYKAHHAR